jgi:hypothetical protein
MRLACLILLLSICVVWQSTAQVDARYKYNYDFNIDPPKDSAYVIIDTLPRNDTVFIIGKLLDFEGKPVSFPSIVVRRSEKVFTGMIGDIDGIFGMRLHPGSYSLTASAQGFKEIAVNFDIAEASNLSFTFRLARQASLDWYKIYSAKPLNEQEIAAIKQCVVDNPDNPAKCKKKNSYFVAIQH